MSFTVFKTAVNEQFSHMAKNNLFVTAVTKDELWDMYLESFPEGSDPIFRERRGHDCQCCKQFIRACGNVVSIAPDLTLQSIWDIDIGDTESEYQIVANALSKLVKNRTIENIFLHYQKTLGTNFNHQELEDGKIKKWEHFHFILPNKYANDRNIGTVLSKAKTNQHVFLRGLEEITNESVEMVLELIDQGSIYRGEEHRVAVASFAKMQKNSKDINSQIKLNSFCWLNADKPGSRIRNTAIGTLLMDISVGMNLDEAVRLFESKVAPENYKRPSALITKSMIKKAQEKISELGYTNSLGRRNATLNDLTINNVLFADRSTKKAMNVFDEMSNEVAGEVKDLKKVDGIDINHFIATILPQSKSIEILLENKHENNLMGLVAPVDPDAPGMFKWGNNFSWAYNGEVADSMKQRVKKMGGKIDGDLRFSIQWNDGDDNQNDFDAHSEEPGGNTIYYRNRGTIHPSSGMLDVDIVNPGEEVAVENIVYSDKRKMPVGEYELLVHCFSHNGGTTGFTAEIEFNGKIYNFAYDKNVPGNRKISVATVSLDKERNFKIIKSLKSTVAAKTMWNINSNQFHKVSMIMNSPNHWDEEQTGNKHYFFILEGCQSGKPIRGFFNEFLKENMTEYRKVLDILGSKMVTSPAGQLCGLGFSSTRRNSLVCKIVGSFERIIKINF
jgi:hypothetical protein